jgi:7,8-dihydro-6-hydroxymethylpterin-pyrophosphokinase
LRGFRESLGLLACGLGTNIGSRSHFLRQAFEGLYLWNLAGGLGTNVGSRIYFLRLAFEGLCLGHLGGGLGTFRLFE